MSAQNFRAHLRNSSRKRFAEHRAARLDDAWQLAGWDEVTRV